MAITRVIVQNYRRLRRADVRFNSALNIVVGDNEAGKSTLLEAINLGLKCQLNRRPAAQELHPFLLNAEAVAEFVDGRRAGKPMPPPRILIELYLDDKEEFADLKGTNNSVGANLPGICLSIELDSDHAEDFEAY
ncbi:AAA family ATPase, partial [Chitinimonas sp. JJ19]|uniref:AAA family ATPase n=1 Tax=Chitinimonas sp. JJ19 TaxID=3109352 RepID=UPI0030037AD5